MRWKKKNKELLEMTIDERKNIQSVPVMQSISSTPKIQNGNYAAGAVDENMLTDEERERVEEYVREINIEDVEQIVRYGETAQQHISEFLTSILSKVKNYDLGEIGDSLKELTIALDATVEPQKKGVLGLFQKAKRGIDSIRANYAKAETNVNRIEKDLRGHQSVLMKDIDVYQQMYELNIQYYKELTMYIIAGKKALELAKTGKLQALKSKADETGMQEDVQCYRDFEDMCHRFEKKLSDLEITRVISIQVAPQVRMLQNNDREMLDKLQSSLANTIPLWRNQLVLSLGIEHTRRALEAQSTLADKTNELLRKNSETLKMATVETAKQAERPIVDIETLRQCNRDLIATINDVIKIHEQGTAKREKAQGELVRIEEELKQTMLETSKHR